MTDQSELMWEGRYLAVRRRGSWEYAERSQGISAAVIVAVDAGSVLLVEQYRVPLGRRCLELPAGLVGDEAEAESVTDAARRELEEETGYRARNVEDCGVYYSSPGMTSECFTLVVASGLEKIGEGGGVEQEDITVHRVPISDVATFVAAKRREGVAIDAKMLTLLGGGLLAAL